jgi:hypothetical protein
VSLQGKQITTQRQRLSSAVCTAIQNADNKIIPAQRFLVFFLIIS